LHLALPKERALAASTALLLSEGRARELAARVLLLESQSATQKRAMLKLCDGTVDGSGGRSAAFDAATGVVCTDAPPEKPAVAVLSLVARVGKVEMDLCDMIDPGGCGLSVLSGRVAYLETQAYGSVSTGALLTRVKELECV
jgi:hypothetical protein